MNARIVSPPSLQLALSLLACVTLATGCASAPKQKEAQAPASDASELYAGQSPIVHGTEFPVTAPEEGVQRGDAAWREGKLELAIYLYVQVLQLAPEDVPTLRKIGALHESLGNRPLARRAFELALERGGADAATMERLGLLYVQDGNDEHANVLLTEATRLEVSRWRAHDGLGVLADRRKDYRAAMTHYEAALRLQPKSATVLNNRGYSRFLQGDLPGAEADLRAAIQLDSTSRARVNLGIVQAKGRRYGDAFKTFLETYDAAHAYNAVGEGAMSNGDNQIARTYFEHAAGASPSYFEEAEKNLTLVREALAGRGAATGS